MKFKNKLGENICVNTLINLSKFEVKLKIKYYIISFFWI